MKERKFGIVRIILIAVLSVVAILALVGFVACSDEETANNNDEIVSSGGTVSDTRQVPVYQGMVISSANSATSYGVQSYAASGSIIDDNVSGDIVGREELVDESHPFGDDSLSIEQEVEKEFGITGVGQDIYYADKNEDVYVTVKFSNPNDYEILSFRINGQAYASYMFESGSDMENIIIKLNVGSVAGFNEYEISEIKYIDGTDIKDVLLNGDTVVRCGVRGDEAAVSVSVANESVTLDTISFSAKVTDNYSLIEESDGYAVAVLYDGSEIIDSKSLSVGDNSVTFSKLNPNTLYQYAVAVVYDDLSGNGVAASFPYVNSVYTETLVLFDNVVVTKTSVSFSFSWYEGYDDSCLHTKFTLEGGSNQRELIDPESREITGLLSDHEYTLNVAYTGIYGDTEAIRLTFRTLAMDAPDVKISASTTQDSLSYTVSVTDTDEVGSISSVTVYHGNEVVYTGTDATDTIDNLLSGNEYKIVVVYSYDLNDGAGVQTTEVSETISTLAKATPVANIEVINRGSDSLTFAICYTDEDQVGQITSIEFYCDDELVDKDIALNEYELTFENLESYTQYSLKVTVEYDLNDGVGPQTKTYEQSVRTDPIIQFSSMTVRNTSAVSEGDTIVIQVSMTNPSNAVFSSVVINGITYEVSSISTTTSLYIEILNNGQFAGGDTTLEITQIAYEWEGNEYLIDVTENNTAYVFINGDIFVEDFELVRIDENGVEENVFYKGKDEDNIYYKISLYNPTGYEIYGVNIDGFYEGESIIVSDDKQTVYVKLGDGDTGWRDREFTSINFKNDNLDKSKSFSYSVTYLGLSSSEIVYISSAADLLNLRSYGEWRYYQLTDDIDLGSYEWVNMGIEMKGIFNGDGHTIKNISGVATYNDTELYLGLFKRIEGAVVNLNIEDELYIMTLGTTMNATHEIYAGGLASESGRVVIVDCKVSSSFQLTNEGKIRIGALIGEASRDTALNNVSCSTSVSLISFGEYEWNKYFGNDGSDDITDCSCEYTLKVNNAAYFTYEGLEFGYSNGKYSLIGYLGHDTEISLPDSIYGSTYEIDEYAFTNSGVEIVFIPNGVTCVKDNAFANCYNLIIFVEAESKPDGWSSVWNSSECPVYWGFSGIPTDNVTFSFDSNGGSYVESISAPYLTTLPTPTKEGYIFLGWYTDQDYTNSVSATLYTGYDITLYAKWLDIDNLVQSAGLEIVNGVIVGIGTCTDSILVICMPIAEKAFEECLQITAIYLYDGCDYIGYRAFYSCDNLKTVYFYQTTMPTLESDIFGNTWDASDFRVYVPSSLYSQYLGVSDNYWQTYLVNSGKLAYM